MIHSFLDHLVSGLQKQDLSTQHSGCKNKKSHLIVVGGITIAMHVHVQFSITFNQFNCKITHPKKESLRLRLTWRDKIKEKGISVEKNKIISFLKAFVYIVHVVDIFIIITIYRH